MTFKIPKDMKFEDINPRKGRGSVSVNRKTIRCGLYVWSSNIRLSTTIGADVAVSIDIHPGTKARVRIGVSNNLVVATYSKGKDTDKGCYIARANGNPKYPRSERDIRFMTTMDAHLQKHFKEKPMRLTQCEYMIEDKSLIVRIHNDLLRGHMQGTLDIDPEGIMGF